MKVSKWGNSLAIRLPAELVAQLGVKEGDELYSIPGLAEESAVKFIRKKTKEERWARLREIAKKAEWPADYKFERKEMYEEHMNNRWKKYDEIL
jgi:antitoxin MazE